MRVSQGRFRSLDTMRGLHEMRQDVETIARHPAWCSVELALFQSLFLRVYEHQRIQTDEGLSKALHNVWCVFAQADTRINGNLLGFIPEGTTDHHVYVGKSIQDIRAMAVTVKRAYSCVNSMTQKFKRSRFKAYKPSNDRSILAILNDTELKVGSEVSPEPSAEDVARPEELKRKRPRQSSEKDKRMPHPKRRRLWTAQDNEILMEGVTQFYNENNAYPVGGRPGTKTKITIFRQRISQQIGHAFSSEVFRQKTAAIVQEMKEQARESARRQAAADERRRQEVRLQEEKRLVPLRGEAGTFLEGISTDVLHLYNDLMAKSKDNQSSTLQDWCSQIKESKEGPPVELELAMDPQKPAQLRAKSENEKYLMEQAWKALESQKGAGQKVCYWSALAAVSLKRRLLDSSKGMVALQAPRRTLNKWIRAAKAASASARAPTATLHEFFQSRS